MDFIQDPEKRAWLESIGLKPLTPELAESFYTFPEFRKRAREGVEQGKFTHYVVIGKEPVLYSEKYLIETPLEELKQRYEKFVRLLS
jgi:hypothetical protein